jgi:hypothetical protein
MDEMDEMYIIIASKIKIWQVIFFFIISYEMKHWYENKVIVVLLIHCHPLETKYCWPYVIESRLNGLNYILNTHTNRKKRQICQVIIQGFSKEYRLYGKSFFFSIVDYFF